MKLKQLAVPAALLLIAGVYISSRSDELLAAPEKRDIVIRAENFVRRINRHDYAACCAAFDELMKSSMSQERMKETFGPILDTLGAFRGFGRVNVRRRGPAGTGYTVCTVRCLYEHGTAAYTILFNKAHAIGGLYIK